MAMDPPRIIRLTNQRVDTEDPHQVYAVEAERIRIRHLARQQARRTGYYHSAERVADANVDRFIDHTHPDHNMSLINPVVPQENRKIPMEIRRVIKHNPVYGKDLFLRYQRGEYKPKHWNDSSDDDQSTYPKVFYKAPPGSKPSQRSTMGTQTQDSRERVQNQVSGQSHSSINRRVLLNTPSGGIYRPNQTWDKGQQVSQQAKPKTGPQLRYSHGISNSNYPNPQNHTIQQHSYQTKHSDRETSETRYRSQQKTTPTTVSYIDGQHGDPQTIMPVDPNYPYHTPDSSEHEEVNHNPMEDSYVTDHQ